MFDLPAVSFGSVTIPATTILTLVIGLVMMLLLTLFIKHTKLGKAMRAVPEDKIASTLVGINVNKIITATFADRFRTGSSRIHDVYNIICQH